MSDSPPIFSKSFALEYGVCFETSKYWKGRSRVKVFGAPSFLLCFGKFFPLKNILDSGAQSTAHSFEELDTFSLSITMLNFCDGVFQLVKQASSLRAHERWTEVRDTATEGCVSAWRLLRSQGRVYCLMPPFADWWGSLATCHTGSGSSTELLVTWRKRIRGSCFIWIFGKTTFRRLNIIDCCPVFSFFFLPLRMACRSLVPQSWIKPVPPAVEAWSLNRWTARKVPPGSLVIIQSCCDRIPRVSLDVLGKPE